MSLNLETTPLYKLYANLLKYEHQLKHQSIDVNSYFLFLKTLQKGYGLTDKATFYALCKAIWLRPHHEEKHFKSLVENYLDEIQEAEEAPIEEKDENPNNKELENSNHKTPKKEIHKEENLLDQKEENQSTPEETKKEETDEEMEMIGIRFGKGETTTMSLPLDDEEIERVVFSKTFWLDNQYFPIAPRKIKQNIRALRIAKNDTTHIIDIKRTIKQVTEQGFLSELILKPKTIYHTPLAILIDHEGSMVAFHHIAEEIAAVIKQQNRNKTLPIYYFKNCPINYLYLNTEHTESIKVETFIKNMPAAMLIISDAGAAKNSYNSDRIKQTAAFLKKLGKRKIAWLNPMPRVRWENTSAIYIAQLVQMFETEEHEFNNAIKILKGKIK